MKGVPGRVLVVTHETSMSGAPRVACLSVKALIDSGYEVQVISRRPGPLLADFQALAPTRLEPLWRWRARMMRRFDGRLASLDTLMALWTMLRLRPELVLVNSVAAGIYARAATWCGVPIVLHVHESGDVYDAFLARQHWRPGPQVALLACSPSVYADMLVRAQLGQSVGMVPSVPDEGLVRVGAAAAPPDDSDALVVGCCGSVEHRKGVDLWLQVADRVLDRLPDRNIRFVWVGPGDPPATPRSEVQFLGPARNPHALMARFDIATLPSRDDPFPLVVIESMLLGKPTVAFNIGGVERQLGDAGVLVPPEDVEAFSEAIVELLESSERRHSLGLLALQRADELWSTATYSTELIRALKRSGQARGETGGSTPPASDG